MIAPCTTPNVLVRYPNGLPGCLRPCALRPGGCGLGCGCSTPAALEGCGCNGGNMHGLEVLDAGAIDMDWHVSVALGSVVGAIAVWWFKRRKR